MIRASGETLIQEYSIVAQNGGPVLVDIGDEAFRTEGKLVLCWRGAAPSPLAQILINGEPASKSFTDQLSILPIIGSLTVNCESDPPGSEFTRDRFERLIKQICKEALVALAKGIPSRDFAKLHGDLRRNFPQLDSVLDSCIPGTPWGLDKTGPDAVEPGGLILSKLPSGIVIPEALELGDAPAGKDASSKSLTPFTPVQIISSDDDAKIWCSFRAGPLHVRFANWHARYNFLVACGGKSFISQVTVRNTARSRSEETILTFRLPGFVEQKLVLKPMDPGSEETFPLSVPRPDAFGLMYHTWLERVGLEIKVDGTPVPLSLPLKIEVFPWNSYLETAPPYALAAFVTYDDPQIRALKRAARKLENPIYRKRVDVQTALMDGHPHDKLKLVELAYYVIMQKCGIAYRREESEQACHPQRIRSNHQVQKNQEGTCIDLALFAAAVLHNFHLQPFLVKIAYEGGDHFLVGCRFDDYPFPLAESECRDSKLKSQFLHSYPAERASTEKAVVFDPVHFTVENPLSFEASVEDTLQQLEACLSILSVVDLGEAWLKSPPMSFRSNGWFTELTWRLYYDLVYRLGLFRRFAR